MKKKLLPIGLMVSSVSIAQSPGTPSRPHEVSRLWVTIFNQLLDRYSKSRIRGVDTYLYFDGEKYFCQAEFDYLEAPKSKEIWVLLPNGSLIEKIQGETIHESEVEGKKVYSFRGRALSLVFAYWYPDPPLK